MFLKSLKVGHVGKHLARKGHGRHVSASIFSTTASMETSTFLGVLGGLQPNCHKLQSFPRPRNGGALVAATAVRSVCSCSRMLRRETAGCRGVNFFRYGRHVSVAFVHGDAVVDANNTVAWRRGSKCGAGPCAISRIH